MLPIYPHREALILRYNEMSYSDQIDRCDNELLPKTVTGLQCKLISRVKDWNKNQYSH